MRARANSRSLGRRLVAAVVVATTVLAGSLIGGAPAVAAPGDSIVVSGRVTLDARTLTPTDPRVWVSWIPFGSSLPEGSVLSDANGRFEFDGREGLYILRFSPVDLRFQSMTANYDPEKPELDWPWMTISATTPLEYRLAELGTVGGRVVLPDGTPVGAGDVSVTARSCWGSWTTCAASPITPAAVTDAEGNFRLSGLYNGRYALEYRYLKDRDFQVPSPLRYVTIDNAQPHASAPLNTLASSTTLRGTVALGGGGRTAGAGEVKVIVRQYSTHAGSTTYEDLEAVTMADGSYEVTGIWSYGAIGSAPEGNTRSTHDVFFDYQGTGYADRWNSATPLPDEQRRMRLTDPVTVLDMTLDEAASVAGTVMSAAGTGIADVTVSAKTSGSALGPSIVVASVKSDAQGHFRFDGLAPGGYSFTYFHQNYPPQDRGADPNHPERTSATLLTAGAAVLDYDMTLYKRVYVSATVHCEECAQPFDPTRVWVKLQRQTVVNGVPTWVDSEYLERWQDGTYHQARFIFPGTYRAVATADSTAFVGTPTEPQVLEDGATATFEISYEMRPGTRDFNGDGNADVIARASTGALYLYPGNGAGGWLARKTIGSGWNAFTSIVGPGDFNGDGNADVIARASTGALYLYPGNGAGGWLARKTIGSGWNAFTAIG